MNDIIRSRFCPLLMTHCWLKLLKDEFYPPAILNIVMLTRYRIITIFRCKKGLDVTPQGTIRGRQNIAPFTEIWMRSEILRQNIDSNFPEGNAGSL